MQTLADACDMDDHAVRESLADPAAVDAVLTASRSMVAVAMRSLGAAAEETSIAQYRALVVLASRGPQRMVDLAGALDVAPSTAGRMCDRLVRNGLIRRHRARGDRRAVLVSLIPAGRRVVDEATARRRALIADILARLPVTEQQAVAEALRVFADAAGEVPDSQWPAAVPSQDVPAVRMRRPAQSGWPGQPEPSARGQRKELP
jgi:DNA-binding MarR family transcriptional regulator